MALTFQKYTTSQAFGERYLAACVVDLIPLLDGLLQFFRTDNSPKSILTHRPLVRLQKLPRRDLHNPNILTFIEHMVHTKQQSGGFYKCRRSVVCKSGSSTHGHSEPTTLFGLRVQSTYAATRIYYYQTESRLVALITLPTCMHRARDRHLELLVVHAEKRARPQQLQKWDCTEHGN